MSVLLVLIGLATWFCGRERWLKGRPWAIGVLFGLLGIAADPLFVLVGDWGGVVRDAPPIAAALFFGPLAGVVAGAVAATWAFFVPSHAAEVVNLWLCPVATLLTALYAAATRRWFFGSDRPAPWPAAIVAAFGEIVHLSVDAFSNAASMSLIVGIGYSAFAREVVAYVGVVVLVAVVCGGWRGWRRNFLSGTAVSMTVFAICFGAFAWYELRQASDRVDLQVADAQRRLEHDIDDQLGFMLHGNAASIVGALRTVRALPRERMVGLAKAYDVDEVNLVGRDGIALASNDETGEGLDYRRAPDTAEFMTLTNAAVSFVKQRFRKSRSNPSIEVKYIGVPFPDGSGFVQLGYLYSRMERDFARFFFPMLVDMSVGASGYYVVANRTSGLVAIDAAGHRGIAGRTLEEIGLVRPAGTGDHFATFTATVLGQLCRCRDAHIGNWSVYCVVPVVDAHASAILAVFFVGLQLLVVCMAFQMVSHRFRLTREKIDRLRANEDARREKDLALARTIQRSALPYSFPEEDDFRIFARMDAAKEVGGDFYDFFALPSGEIGFLVADVSGKSVPGAMFMMQAKMVLRSCIFGNGNDLSVALAEANAHLCENNVAEMFVTAWVGVYDRSARLVRYVSAGHNPPLVKRAGGGIEWVRTRPCMPLAAIKASRYREETLALGSGDTLVLYTDGVTEATNARLELYGEARLETAFATAEDGAVNAIRADVDRFVAGAEQADDITILEFHGF